MAGFHIPLSYIASQDNNIRLRRTQSMTDVGAAKLVPSPQEAVRVKEPIRANSKRRRSTAPSGATSQRTALLAPTDGVTLTTRSPNSSHGQFMERTPSRGRTRHRERRGPNAAQRRHRRSHNSQQESHTRQELDQLSHSSKPKPSQSAERGASYTTVGKFRLQKYLVPTGFRVLLRNPRSQSPCIPCDGFSGDEMRPILISSLTGKRRRKAPRTSSALTQLQVESDNEDDKRISTSWLRSRKLIRRNGNFTRSEIQDPWPTRENFLEPLNSRAASPVIIEATWTPRQRTTPPTSNPIPRPEGPRSDFASFGGVIRDNYPDQQRTLAPALSNYLYSEPEYQTCHDEGREYEQMEIDERSTETSQSLEDLFTSGACSVAMSEANENEHRQDGLLPMGSEEYNYPAGNTSTEPTSSNAIQVHLGRLFDQYTAEYALQSSYFHPA
ncbi:hypothetical protein F5Y16DRAFT_406370 [Xylariaceae sp. FL0255]|nr:hypothetical protein F5Y16DRAFT_406370 [Xylariaceae sp. FL0255]